MPLQAATAKNARRTEGSPSPLRHNIGATEQEHSATAALTWKEMESVYSASPMPQLPARLAEGREPFPVDDSMLAYTQRMREISRFRQDTADYLAGEALAASNQHRHPVGRTTSSRVTEAGHVPGRNSQVALGKGGRTIRDRVRRRIQQQKQQRRPMSLDDDIVRPRDKNPDDPSNLVRARQKLRPLSDIPSLASTETSRRERGGGENVGDRGRVFKAALASSDAQETKRLCINFVSAADLFELVDFNLHSKVLIDDGPNHARDNGSFRFDRGSGVLRPSFAGAHRLKAGRLQEAETAGDKGEADTAWLLSASPRDSLQLFGDGRFRHTESGSDEGSTDTAKEGVSRSRKKDEDSWARNEFNKSRISPIKIQLTDDDSADKAESRAIADAAGRGAAKGLDLDLLSEKHQLLLHPQKLHFRPKRAKRMRLHRSLLSVIPEDERNRKEDLPQQQEVTSPLTTLLPGTNAPFPSNASLAAIKDFRKQKESGPRPGSPTASVSRDETPTRAKTQTPELDNPKNSNKRGATTDLELPSAGRPRVASVVPLNRKLSSVNGDSGSPPRRRNLDVISKAPAGTRQSGRSTTVYVTDSSSEVSESSSRTKAHKKFRKLIFLREQPECVYPVRYS